MVGYIFVVCIFAVSLLYMLYTGVLHARILSFCVCVVRFFRGILGQLVSAVNSAIAAYRVPTCMCLYLRITRICVFLTLCMRL